MKIITGVPVFVNKMPTPSELYANANGKELPKAPLNFSPTKTTNIDESKLSSTNPKGEKKKGHFWDRAKGTWVKAKDSGLVDKGAGLFNKLFGSKDSTSTDSTTTDTTVVDTGAGTPTPTKREMSTATKIGITVGAVVIIGAIYLLTKKKK